MKKTYYCFIYLFLLLIIQFQSEAQTTAQAGSKGSQYGKSFFEKDTVHTIRINFLECNALDSLKRNKKIQDSLLITTYVQATVSIDGKKMYACGVRYKGESSYEFYPGDKKSFRIKFDKFVKGQDFHGLEDLNLNNNFKDPTMLREKIYLDLLNKYNCPAPRATFAKVFVNDKFMGIYLVTDNIDDVFLKRNFTRSNGILFQGEPLANFEYLGKNQVDYYPRYILKNNKIQNDWTALLKFIELVNDVTVSEEEFMKKLENNFALDKCLTSWAINSLIGNIDSYNIFYPHNFFFYFDSLDKKWNWISVDGNYAFAAWNPVKSFDQLVKMSVLIPDSVPYVGPRPLLKNTIEKNSLIKQRYLKIVERLINSDFKPEVMNAKIDSLSMKIRLYVYTDNIKMYTNEDFNNNLSITLGDPLDPGNFIPGLKVFIAERKKHVEAELKSLLKN